MRLLKLFTVIGAMTLFIAGCNSTQTDEIATAEPYQNQPSQENATENVDDYNDDYVARENFDLQAVGDVFRESDTAEDFERRLNSDDGVNNIDLNGDGYADYISVEEYKDQDTGYRGFSLFDRFGGTDAIQEIATIVLDRTLNDNGGSRFYINGNDQIYGDNYNYQADWKDTTLDIVSWAFGNRDEVYQSPYYYDNYPDNYETYRVIETPVYRNRVRENYYDPVFIQVNNDDFNNYTAKSPYRGKSYDKIYAKLEKPNDYQKEFRKNNRKRLDFVADDRERVKGIPPGLSKKAEKEYKKQEKEYRKEEKDYRKEEKEYQKDNNSFEDRSDKRERKEQKSERKEKRRQDFKENNDGSKNFEKEKGKNKGGKGGDHGNKEKGKKEKGGKGKN